jgi:hypothetical protein
VLLKICSVAKATLAKDATNSKIIGCHSTCKAGICKSINVHIAQLIRAMCHEKHYVENFQTDTQPTSSYRCARDPTPVSPQWDIFIFMDEWEPLESHPHITVQTMRWS